MTEPLGAIYLSAYRARAHLLVYMGYQGARGRCVRHAHEPAITGYIAAALEEKIRDPHGPRWLQRVSIKENSPQNDAEAVGAHRVMPDLVVEFIDLARPEYMFEAKRLSRPNFHASKYLGSDGLGCFIDTRYASRYAEAGMLGYVQSDSVVWWANYLKNKLAEKASDYCVIPEIKHTIKSIHNRGKLSGIDVYHILLDCTHSD